MARISDHQQSWGYEEGPSKGPRNYALPVTFSGSDGVLEYWSDGLSLVNSMRQRLSMSSV